MADVADGPTPTEDSEALDSLKIADNSADTTPVEDGIGSSARWNWSPVTDAGGPPRVDDEAQTDRSSFQFDLGSALARLGGDSEPQSAPDSSVPAPPLAGGTPVPEDVRPQRPSEPSPLAEPSGSGTPPAPLPPREAHVPPPTPQVSRVEPMPPLPTPPVPRVEQVGPDPSSLSARAAQAAPTSPQPAVGPVVTSGANDAVAARFDDEPLPRRSRGPVAAPVPPVVPQQREQQREQQRDEYQPPPSRTNAPVGSVFDPAAPAPALPARSAANRTSMSPSNPVAAAGPQLPSGRPDMSVQAATGALPTLPAATPAAPPAMTMPVTSAPAVPDINALRSAQLRASRQQRQGKVFGRMLLAVLGVGALIAAALIFGRSYLFPTDWDASLTPVVDAIQESTGVEFDHTVPLIVQPPDEYATTLIERSIGSDWEASVPEWRALGLANGDVTASSIAAELAQAQPAFYDPASDTIFQVAGSDPEQAQPALEAALVAAFQHQTVSADENVVETARTGFTGVSTPQSIARRAVDTYLSRGLAIGPSGVDATAVTSETLPVPIAYEFAAVDRLGASILRAAGAEPTTFQIQTPYPGAIYGALDDDPTSAPSPLLRAGEQPLTDALALGADDWSLVWGVRLPALSVERAAEALTADSYRSVSRDGATCFVALLQTATQEDGLSMFGAMQLWASRAPQGSQAAATLLTPTRVQLEACDPGAGVTVTSDVGTVDSLIDRQIVRLDG